MSTQVTTHEHQFTQEQLGLIKSTVAKNATDDELKLFLYRCKNLGLDPLKPGQIHFVKYGSSPGTIVVGIDGFRAKAQRTGKLTGVKRGLIINEDGECEGAWAEVYRSDWVHPAREEVDMVEYNTGKAMWARMPRTMIKKVAECAALRMAFPDDLGGIYAEEEMQQASHEVANSESSKSSLRDGAVDPLRTSATGISGARGANTEAMHSRTGPSEKQLKRLFAISKKANWSPAEVKDYMWDQWQKESSKDLNYVQYDELCKYIEAHPVNEDAEPASDFERLPFEEQHGSPNT